MLTVSLLLRELINVKLRNAVRRFFRAYPHAWWAFYFVFFILLFVVTEHVVDGSGPYWSSYVPLDDKIPFWEIFVIPVVPLFVLALFLQREYEHSHSVIPSVLMHAGFNLISVILLALQVYYGVGD